ncbi:hypothetical protein [Rodentibacter genomosp. 2]|uniref:Uncharacterized protein n=1 Tax=Rodentibacter genomosp. 2 TaxID=1908266 RepID=A0A1V3JEJ0_9PAST|nr:hypothetical protein [Rodentibacter genomosp. 2]OOF55200.1 hypothetical protein BKK56_07110 [Rodentibacter genomosp. 2]OOF58853.1 hypothetical protein BKK55_01305 [Rodentibacter genomosp. 2]
MNFLIDAKIISIKFDFDASNVLKSQDLVFEVEKLEDKLMCYTVKFIDVSSFQVFLEIGENNISPSSYEADSMYISSIIMLEQYKNHKKWKIELIDNVGSIEVFSNDIDIIRRCEGRA